MSGRSGRYVAVQPFLEKNMLTSFQKKVLFVSLMGALGCAYADGDPSGTTLSNRLRNRTDIAYTNHATQNVDINLVFNKNLNLDPKALVSATVSDPQKNLHNNLFQLDPNVATTNGSVAGVSGNAGINNAAGTFNQQANNASIAHGNSGTQGFIARSFSNSETASVSNTHSDSDSNSSSWSRAASQQFADSSSHTSSNSRTIAVGNFNSSSNTNTNTFSHTSNHTSSNAEASSHNSSNSTSLTASLNANLAAAVNHVHDNDSASSNSTSTSVVVPPPPVSFVSTSSSSNRTLNINNNSLSARLDANLHATLSHSRSNSSSDSQSRTNSSSTTTSDTDTNTHSNAHFDARTFTASDANTSSESHSRSASRSYAAAASHSDSNADTSSYSDTRTSNFVFSFYQPLGVAVESQVSYEQLSDGNLYTSINPGFPGLLPGAGNNTTTMNGSVVGVTGNAGVNTVAGVGNQQENDMALANTAEYSVLAAATAGGFQVNSGNNVIIAGPLTNTSTMSGSIAGVSGNVGVNVAAGFSNQQVNALSIAASSR
jgi:hypothetical protein